MKTVIKMHKTIYEIAQKELENEYTSCINCMKENSSDVGITSFVNRFFEWARDKEKGILLWEMFDEPGTISIRPKEIFSSLHSFVANCLLDDSCFIVEYEKPVYNKDYKLIWLPGGGFKKEKTTKDDPNGKPVVRRGNDDNGTQNVDLLLEAMDIMEQRDKQRSIKLKKFLNEKD